MIIKKSIATPTSKEIYFAGGCFWGIEAYFSRINGVISTSVGYANGLTAKPTYQQVCRGDTGYAETIHIVYNPAVVSLRLLTEHFFKIIDPVSVNKQGNDVGTQYRSGIYYTDVSDEPLLQALVAEVQACYRQPLAVELKPLSNYVKAEEYHQQYLKKNPTGYCHISFDTLSDLQQGKE